MKNEIKLVKTQNGEIASCLVSIYLREAYSKTLQFLPPISKVNRMIGFNLGMLKELKQA